MTANAPALPTITFTVNGKTVETTEHTLTVRRILELAGLDPNTHYLVEKHGDGKETEYRDLNADVHVHDKQVFLAFFTGPTPVS
jgi:uncharacterized protein YabE (DUF348 family)